MKRGIYQSFIFICLISVGQLSAQRIMVSDLNKHQKGAVYKFSFAHLTDIHVGEGIDDYGSPGFNDTMPIGDVGYSAVSLRSSVRWINAHAKQKNIRFVIITGDLTDSGEKSEFDKANEILSALAIPFVPQIGNHDVRPHTHALNAATASGDSVNNVVFAGEFDTLKHFMDKWDDGFRQVRVYSPYSRHEQFFQNFMFEYQGFGFVFFDLSPRFIYGRPKTDHGPRPRLNDFPNGSFDWLKNTLQAFPDKRDHNIFLFSHQPPHQDFMSIFNGLHRDEYDKLTHALLPYRSHLAYWIAGHVHRNRSYSVHTPRKHKFVMKVRETAANKEHKKGLLRIINVYEAPGK